MPGATWRQGNVSVAGGVLRMTSSTDGSYAGTTQTQICQQRKFREGTYASHVRFRNAPISGPAGDQPVESFYTISPLKRPLDPNYSEIDFEYLPRTVVGEIRKASASPRGRPTARRRTGSSQLGAPRGPQLRNGWHTLVLQVAHGTMTFYVDGTEVALLGGRYYPEVPMSINYNLWFIPGGLSNARIACAATRRTSDWVYHAARAGSLAWEVADAGGRS